MNYSCAGSYLTINEEISDRVDGYGAIDVITTVGVVTQVVCRLHTESIYEANHVTVMLSNGFAEYPGALGGRQLSAFTALTIGDVIDKSQSQSFRCLCFVLSVSVPNTKGLTSKLQLSVTVLIIDTRVSML